MDLYQVYSIMPLGPKMVRPRGYMIYKGLYMYSENMIKIFLP